MAVMIFKVDGGGDSSVGIGNTHAMIIIEDNYKEVDELQQEIFREFLREFYDIPKHMGSVLTLQEYEKERQAQEKYFEDMRKDYLKDLGIISRIKHFIRGLI